MERRARVLLSEGTPVSISRLRYFHKGEVVYVLGSGKSLDFLPKTFFDDKTVVGVNATHRDWPTTYLFAHHREDAQDAIDRGRVVVASEYDQGRRENGLNEFVGGSWFQYKHPRQPDTLRMDMTPMERDFSDELVIGSNTVTSAMDFAGRILGATTLFLCGVDGGSIDGEWNYSGYNGGVPCDQLERRTTTGSGIPHVRAQGPLIQQVVAGLRACGVAIFSLRLEGHDFKP